MILERMPDAPLNRGAMIFDPEVAAKFANCGINLLKTRVDAAADGRVSLSCDATAEKLTVHCAQTPAVGSRQWLAVRPEKIFLNKEVPQFAKRTLEWDDEVYVSWDDASAVLLDE